MREGKKCSYTRALSLNYLNTSFIFEDIEYVFRGFFDNNTCLIEHNGTFYECNFKLLIYSYNLSEKNLSTGSIKNVYKSNTMFNSKHIRRLINILD